MSFDTASQPEIQQVVNPSAGGFSFPSIMEGGFAGFSSLGTPGVDIGAAMFGQIEVGGTTTDDTDKVAVPGANLNPFATPEGLNGINLTEVTDKKAADFIFGPQGTASINKDKYADGVLPKKTDGYSYFYDGDAASKADAITKGKESIRQVLSEKFGDGSSSKSQAGKADKADAKPKPDASKKPERQPPKPLPSGGGGGGGGTVPDRVDHKNKDRDNSKDRNGKSDRTTSKLPKAYEEMGKAIAEKHADGSEGMHKGSYDNYLRAVYGGGALQGAFAGLMSAFADIDNDPNLSPEEKAAKKAELMKKYQSDHKPDIEKNAQAFGGEASEFGDASSATNLNKLANNLTDASSAGNIANILSQGDKASSQDLNAVFNQDAKTALGNLALIQKRSEAEWSKTTTNEAELSELHKKQAAIAAAIVSKPFTFKLPGS